LSENPVLSADALDRPGLVRVVDDARVRTVTLDRADALNAFNEALYDAVTDTLLSSAEDPGVAVVLLTGNGRAFCAGTDLLEMAARTTDPDFKEGVHGFTGLIDALIAFPKPLIIAVNGLGLGIGTTILGFADLAFMSATARLKCPFTSLGVAPEAASSFTFPALVGRQNATWVLMSSEWIEAEEAHSIGLVWKVTEPEALVPEAYRYASLLAARPISSLVHTKAAIVAPFREQIEAARGRESASFAELMGGPANAEALAAFAEKRPADFTRLPPGA
jgi:enoyl-CoA hydratase/carnithine racemase